ncbi:unnamed protein product, partial [Adineta ricciae]
LQHSVNWTIDSQIIIATTGDFASQNESEVRRVTNISSDGRTLTLDRPVDFTHLGVVLQFNATTIEVRAEVGLLSHNIIFQGTFTTTQNFSVVECTSSFTRDIFTIDTCSSGQYNT